MDEQSVSTSSRIHWLLVGMWPMGLVIAISPTSTLGDWCEADRLPLWLDLTQRCDPEGSRHPYGERWHGCHCGIPRTWCGLHLLHW